MNNLDLVARQEVFDAHILIERWFNGTNDHSIVEDLLRRFSPNFSMVTPKGTKHSFASLKEMFLQMNGTRPGVKIVVEDCKIIYHSATLVISTFEEHQFFDNKTLKRLSTAVFVPGGKSDALWQHLHETWMEM